ncbi:unnamed protein product [Polarella glacialis]|uniref:Spatacsin C-terminal domain-containing protein n=1 Tax=Polarella glacialis TaxID=89957 RepID=A0A813L5W0_POLGL|nr:unnamed protein product [Polarella glacialis]
MAQRMPLELYDMWAGYQTPVMAAMLDIPNEARRAWASLPCGDVEDLDPTPVLGLSNFHKGSNLEKDGREVPAADMREPQGGGESESDLLNGLQSARAAARSSCRRCRQEPEDELEVKPSQLMTPDDAFLEALGLDDSEPKSHTMGYLHITLSWMREWSWETRARIVMEKTHFWPRLVEPLAWLQPPLEAGSPERAWQHCWLDFLVAHQDWRGLAAWVRSLPLSPQDCIDEHGKSCVDLARLEGRGLQELGHRGIFCSGDAETFPALLRRLALCSKLFGEAPSLSYASTDLLVREEQDAGSSGLVAGGAEGDATPSSRTAEGSLPLDRLLPLGRVSPFHRFFICFCIDRDLPALLLLYLQRYDLATTMLALEELQIRHCERPWASLLLVGRLGNAHLFAASLQHAASVCKSPLTGSSAEAVREDAEGVPYMPLTALAEARPIAFLATLMFAPMSSALEFPSSAEAAPWAVDRKNLRKAVAAYPALCETFFPEGLTAAEAEAMTLPPTSCSQTSNALGTSLVEAVAQANTVRWSKLGSEDASSTGEVDMKGTLCNGSTNERNLATRHMAAEDMSTFKGDVTLSTLLGDVAAIDVAKALRRLPIFDDASGKECEALDLAALAAPEEHFEVLMTKCMQRLGPGEELRFPLVLPAEDARRLRKEAKSVAMHNLLNEGVVSSAVCLLELCSLETEKLRVDVEAAKRIYIQKIALGQRGSGGDRRSAAASVIELFLSFPDTEDAAPSKAAEAAISSAHLLNALRMLEESTWALDPHPSAPSSSSIQSLGYDSPWHLVALFCRVHSLPRSLTLLHELARNNDWVMFLYESDLQQCPADTMLDIVGGYFTEVPLQNHLRILARSIASQEQESQSGQEAREEQNREEPVDHEKQTDDRLDPADAVGFLESHREKGIGNGWGLLHHALLHRKARLAVVASCFNDATPLQCMAVWLTVNTARSQLGLEAVGNSSPLTAQTTPAEVSAQIANLCRKSHAFSLVLRALKIFDPDNPLVDFVRFHKAFVQCRFKSCCEHLRNFVGRRRVDARQGSYSLEVSPYIDKLSEDMVWYLLDGFPRTRMMLLSALDEAGFSPHYSQLFRALRLIQQTGLDVDFRVPSAELLQLLISKKMFSEAREWARSSSQVGDTVVFEEVTGMIVEFRQGAWWNVLAERLQLWHKCYDAFMMQSYPPAGAASFFLDISAKLEPDLFAREQLVLLCIAHELLTLPLAAQAPSEEQINHVKLSSLLILIGTSQDLTADLDFSPLDLSYRTVRSLVHRIPEGVPAMPSAVACSNNNSNNNNNNKTTKAAAAEAAAAAAAAAAPTTTATITTTTTRTTTPAITGNNSNNNSNNNHNDNNNNGNNNSSNNNSSTNNNTNNNNQTKNNNHNNNNKSNISNNSNTNKKLPQQQHRQQQQQ